MSMVRYLAVFLLVCGGVLAQPSGGPANQPVNEAQINGVTPLMGNGVTGTGSQRVTISSDNSAVSGLGAAAIGGTLPANVVLEGCRAQNAEATAVTNGLPMGQACDLVGKAIVLPYANPENFVSGTITTAMTGTTSTSLVAAPGASLRNYLTQCVFANSHATVGTMMNLQDGNGGTAFYTFPAGAVYGGASVTFPTPLRQPTTNTAVYVVNVTTGASTFASCSGYKGS